MPSALDDLITLLDLEVVEVNIFRGVSPQENRQRVFGGQVAGQALVAASRTVDDKSRHVHSLHAYFLRPGDPTIPILYEVDRIRDGKSFTTRRVIAIQHGKAIFNLQASFQITEPGLEYSIEMPKGLPQAETLPDFKTRMEPFKDQMGEWFTHPRPIDLRHIDSDPLNRKNSKSSGQKLWMRADGKLPDDPVLHACIVTYASDMSILDTTLLPHGRSWTEQNMQMASLDHVMWFHRPFRADDWLLYDQTAISTSNARGIASGYVFSQSGELVVTIVQEGLVRLTAK